MPDITNVEAVRFCNEKVRPIADRLAQAYYAAKQVKQEWDANLLGAQLPVSADVVVDGAAVDGRHPITGNDVQAVIARCADLIADLEANGGAKLNTLLSVAVHIS